VGIFAESSVSICFRPSRHKLTRGVMGHGVFWRGVFAKRSQRPERQRDGRWSDGMVCFVWVCDSIRNK
jgi:hypothetical protein